MNERKRLKLQGELLKVAVPSHPLGNPKFVFHKDAISNLRLEILGTFDAADLVRYFVMAGVITCPDEPFDFFPSG